MTKTIIAIIIGGALVLSVFILMRNDTSPTTVTTATPVQNVTMENGKQIVTVAAKGGYSPRLSTAKAGVPTILRMTTNGTFDCSSTVKISSLGIQKNLPPTGSTDIEIPAQTTGTTVQALCIMGMYNFEIAFE